MWEPGEHDGSWRAVWVYSAKRAARDARDADPAGEPAKAVVAGEEAARTPRFVKTSNGARSLDEASLARARRLESLKGYLTTIPAALMPAREVIAFRTTTSGRSRRRSGCPRPTCGRGRSSTTPKTR